MVGAAPGDNAFGSAAASRVVVCGDEFAVVGHHDAFGFANGFVSNFGGAVEAFVDLVAGVGVNIEALGLTAPEVLVCVGACGNSLCLERFELGFVELADFVGNDASQVFFDVDDVDGVYFITIGGNDKFAFVAGFVEGGLFGSDGDAFAGRRTCGFENAAVRGLLAFRFSLDFEFAFYGGDVQFFVLLVDDDAWHAYKNAHLDRAIELI